MLHHHEWGQDACSVLLPAGASAGGYERLEEVLPQGSLVYAGGWRRFRTYLVHRTLSSMMPTTLLFFLTECVGVTKPYRFQVCNSTKHHLHPVPITPSKASFCSLPLLYPPPPTPTPFPSGYQHIVV